MCEDSLRLDTQRRVAAGQLLSTALEAPDRAASLPVWFQPIVSLSSRRIIGA